MSVLFLVLVAVLFNTNVSGVAALPAVVSLGWQPLGPARKRYMCGMRLRWFTPDRQEHDAEVYAVHIERIRHRLERGADELIDLDLHDGQVKNYDLREGVFRITVLTGDLQRGYQWTRLTYRGAQRAAVA